MATEISGRQFETRMCWILHGLGYWTHRISKDERGSQPFDIIAIKGDGVLAVDCKVCSLPKFQISRAEINQRLSFSALQAKTNARCGFMCYYDGDIYFVPHEAVGKCEKSFIRLDENNLWMNHSDSLKAMEGA